MSAKSRTDKLTTNSPERIGPSQTPLFIEGGAGQGESARPSSRDILGRVGHTSSASAPQDNLGSKSKSEPELDKVGDDDMLAQ